MSKQTSIDWFNEQIINKQNGNGDSRSWDELFQHAQQMHKEEIVDTFGDSRILSITNNCNSGEQYYQETYGGGNNG